MPLLYKTLFEVKLMHEYFLTRRDGSTIFELNDPQQRINFLQEEFANARPSISDDLHFEFPPHLKDKYESYNLRVLPAYSGCKVVVRVNAKILIDGSTVYSPFVPLAGLTIFILASRKNQNIDGYTNSRISKPASGIYFFSNLDIASQRTFPFLTGGIPGQDSFIRYEQGELSLSGSQVLAYLRQAEENKWLGIKGQGFANETDRLLLPLRFQYRFDNFNNLREARFVLKDNNGNGVADYTINSTTDIRVATADFSGKVIPLQNAGQTDLKSLLYTLDVSGNNGFSDKRLVIFSNELSNTNCWAVIGMGITATNSSFNLFANDGFLKHRKDALGIRTPAPVFEIPVTSRFVYWRFINNRGRSIRAGAAIEDYVDKEGHVLVTKSPRSLAKSYFLLKKESPDDTVYVPNPVTTAISQDDKRRMFLDIRVPESEMFPLDPP